MKFDLHCHSHYSDGSHSADFLIKRAISNKVTHLAITDHDCMEVSNQQMDIPQALTLISGVEISCDWLGQEIHIVGLGVNPTSDQLSSLLETQQLSRLERVKGMADKLAKLGNTKLEEHFESLPCISQTRSHVASFLVDQGLCKNQQQAFKKYLSKKGKLYVRPNWCELKQAVSSINDAGGLAVVAHPSRYPYTRRKLKKLLDEFKQHGGEAMETSYSNLDPLVRKNLDQLCDEAGLFASCGSDFHSADNQWTDIGKFPTFSSAKKNAIWNHPRWHY